ncbi:MAG: DUF732 domain-containing protein [Mycobacterium sp.]|nr:DUF732 domain-containing protein [Mycobacterium sp.]
MRLLLFLASSAAVIGLAAPVQADDADPNFVAALNNAGITYQNGADATGIGRRECQLMDQGHSEADVIKAMVDQNPGFTTDAATRFTRIAETVYCPQHTFGVTEPPPAWQPPIDFPIVTPPAL